MAIFGSPLSYIKYEEELNKTDVKLKLEHIEIKCENCDTYSPQEKFQMKEEHIEIKDEERDTYFTDVVSNNIESNVSNQNANTTEFDLNIAKDVNESDICRWQKEHKCSLCDFVTNSLYNLKHHVVNVHNTGAYECPNCDYRTHVKYRLKNHLRLKTQCQIRLARMKKSDESNTPQVFCTKQESGFKCIYCDYISRKKQMVKRHVYKVHLKLKTNSCLHCEFKTPYKITLESHMVRKHPEHCDPLQGKIRSCLHCEFKTLNKMTLESHMMRQHPEKCDTSQVKTYSCLHCKFKTLNKMTLDSHMVCRHPEQCDPSQLKTRSCLLCGFKTGYLESHMMHKHPEKCNAPQLQTLFCLHCKFKTRYQKTLESHMVRKHSVFKCIYCEYSSIHKSHLKRHVKTVHLQLKSNSCLHCEFQTPYTRTLESHMVRQHPEKCDQSQIENKYCDLCNKMYSTVYTLQKHMQIKHSGENVRCSLCEYTCVRDKELEFHMKRFHKQQKLFECYDCGYTSPRKLILREHILRKHLNLKEYTCDLCSFKTLYWKTLIGHAKIHNCPERLTCEYCSFITLNGKALEKHIKVQHTDSSFKCDQCDYRTFAKGHLTRHIDCKHNKIEHVCQVCGKYKYTDRSNLLSHMYKVHGKQPIRPRKKLCRGSPNIDFVDVKVEDTNDLKPEILKTTIKSESNGGYTETVYVPSLLDYKVEAVAE